jgi:flagellar basal-body rod modification protein FlgD
MSTINPNAATYNDGAGNSPSPMSNGTDTQNQFIALMVAQIRNQDPTKPVDSAEFLSQFAAMSQVQSLENMSALAAQNLVLQDNLQTLTAAALVGQTVKVALDSLELDGEKVKGEVDLKHSSGQTVLTLTDANGVKTEIKLPASEAGVVKFEIDPVALGLKPGKYGVEVKTDSGETTVVQVEGVVTGVKVSSQGPILDIKGVGGVPFYNITEFGKTSSPDVIAPRAQTAMFNHFQRGLFHEL